MLVTGFHGKLFRRRQAARRKAGILRRRTHRANTAVVDAAALQLRAPAPPRPAPRSGWDDTDGTRAPTRNANTLVEDDAQKLTDGFHDFLVALRAQAIAFGKPVTYLHGDSHYFRVDKPLLDSKGKRITNFTRVETFGDHQPNLGDVNWLKVNVDPSSREVFSYEQQIVNRDPVLVP